MTVLAYKFKKTLQNRRATRADLISQLKRAEDDITALEQIGLEDAENK